MITKLKKLLKSLALAEAIIEPEWEYRYFSYDSKWGANEEMASMRDGQGGNWFILFQEDRIGYKCISPEDGLIENLAEIKAKIPQKYNEFINEPAFYVDEATSIWILEGDDWIKYGKQEVKWIIDLEKIINWKVEDYKRWAEDYYERELDIESLRAVFDHRISDAIIKALNPDISSSSLKNSLDEIGIKP